MFYGHESREKEKDIYEDNVLIRALSIKVYPNHSQKRTLKRWMGLAKFDHNAVVRWSCRRQGMQNRIRAADILWIRTCCVLHNFLLANPIDEEWMVDEDMEDDELEFIFGNENTLGNKKRE